MNWIENSVCTSLPLVTSMLACEVRADIPFPVPTILIDDHGSGKRIRRKKRARVANAPRKAQHKGWRKGVHVMRLAARLLLRDILPLARLLLDQLVRHQIADRVLRYGE